MDERVPPGGGRLIGQQDCSDLDYTKDIEEIHYGASTSEDDEDEPRLTIDTSEDEEDDGTVENSSSSFPRRRKPSLTSRLKIHPAIHRGAPATSKFNPNPLHSLQQLVHSPFLNAQISAADGGINQGCKITPLIKDNRSKSNHDKYSPENAQSLAAAAEALRNIFSSNVGPMNNYDQLPTLKSAATSSTANSVAKSKKSSNAAKRNNNTNFQRLSPVSIEVVPSLSHLLPLSQHSPSSPPMPQPAFAEKCDSTVRSTNSNRLNYIVSKLQRSATEEEHLRQLQQLQSSPEAENFKMFQQFLKSGQFQARCNNNNLEILPATAVPSTQSSNTINLTNSKGFRYASSNAQTRPTFGGSPSTSLPPPPPLTFKSTPNERMDFRMPPTLTVIPKSSSGGSKKSNFRRSPPPMVPIESIANFRKPLNEDNVVYRLKKLGTDIELEKNTAASRDDQAAVEELAAAAKSASVTSNSNNSDKASLPFLKPIPIGERVPNDLKNNALSKLHPPPPSLIPIKPINQFVPILPSPVTQSTISEVPIKLRRSTGGRLSPSLMAKLGRNLGAKLGRNSGSCEMVDGSQMMFGKGSSNDVIPFQEDMAGGNLSIMAANPALDFSQHSPVTQSTINEVPIKLRRSAGGRLSPSLLAKLARNSGAKLARNSGSCEMIDGGQMAFGKGSPNDVIFPSKEDMVGNVPIMTANPAMDFSQHYSRLMAAAAASNKVTKKKRRRLSAKSEYTKLAHALVQAATPLPKKDEIDRPVIVPTRNETSPKEYELCDSEREIITIEPILMPDSRYESEEEDTPNGYDLPLVHEDEYVDVPDNSSPPPESAPTTLPAPAATSSQQNGPVDETDCFMFSPSLAIQLGVLPNGRKMLSCDICSGVYHKMFSLKKHYYRNHINPKFISAKHFDMFKLEPTSPVLSSNPKFHSSMYWCNICNCLFDEKHELSSHLTDHPPLALENSNNSQLYMCPSCNMVFSRKRTQDRHSKKCAKLQTKTVAASSTTAKPDSTPNSGDEEGPYDNAAEETNSTTSSKNNDDVNELDEMSKNSKLETSMMCLFCELSFTDTTKRKKHVLQHHHPKRKHQPCVYCKNKTFSDLSDLLKHICEMHSKRYFGCAICKIRFRTKEDLVAHNAESHEGEIADVEKEPVVEEKVKPATISNKNGKNYKCNQCTKVFINTVELGRHRKTAHRDSSRNNIKKVVSAFSGPVDSNEQKYRSTIITTADYETEFYRNVCHNVKYNLENCMEGRIEMQKEENSDEDLANDPRYANAPGIAEIGEEKSASLSFHDLYGTENIDSRFIQNVSRLHLGTQLTMLRKANLLDKELDCPLRTKTSGGRNSTIASRLALAEKSDGERADDEAKNENDAANEIVFTGEWIRARNYICGTCFARFNNFWDMEDHRWSRHPNVYNFYYEFVTEQAPGSNWAMKRTLQNHGALDLPTNHTIPSSSTCTKCQKVITPVSEFHKHILECGGDTTWMSMMFAAHTKRNKKWRPYGSRRRKNIARHRGLKRNIPTTPVKIIGPPRNRQKAGDTETIQRMIANLPPKRITRRVITFDDLEARPKGRLSNNSNSQSNILTRKRKESMEVRSSTTSRSQQLQQDSKQNVTTSKTLLGTKNNTPYNNASTPNSRSRHEQMKSNSAASMDQPDPIAVESKPDHVRLRSEDATEITTRSASSLAKTKPVQIETEIKEDSPEPEVSSVKITSLKSTKTAKSIPAKDTESSSGETAISVTTSNRHESDTNAKPALPSKSSKSSTSKPDSLAEPETSPESVSQPKAKSTSAEDSTTPGTPTVVKITTHSKNHASANKTQPDADPEPVPIRKLRSSDDSNFTHVESVFEPKKNSSRDEQAKTESKSTSEVSTTLELRSGTGSRNKPLIIKIQSESKHKNSSNDQPVTIIRSDKKKKKRCTPVTSKRLAPEIPPPSKSPTVDVEETQESPSMPKDVPAELPKPVVVAEEVKELSTETKPVEVTENLENATVKTENLVPEVKPEEVEDSIVASEKSDLEVTIEKSDDSAASEKSVSEVESEISKDSITSLDTSVDEATPLVESKEPEDSPVKLETSVPESAPAPEPVTTDEELEQSSTTIEKSTIETSSIETETKDESVSTETDNEDETETRKDLVTTVDTIPDVSVDSTTTESQIEPTKTTIELEPIPVSKPEPEEGEIDLSTIEPADEDGPALPDTSVILAAMKETMRQTDAVISSMPVAVNSSKKRKRDDAAKCKKCGVKMESSTNTAPICENCTEIPAKKSKPAPPPPPPPPKIETFDCKVCHVSVPKNVRSGSNDEMCDECVASAAATAAAAASAAAAATAAAVNAAAAAAAIKVDKPTPKKCSSKMKETRIQPPPPFRCRKCDSIGLAPPDGSTFCEKCSRLQETVCLLCKSSYISDTNDKVCGKCMLAGSSKQKKRIVDNDSTPAIVTSTVADTSEKKSPHCDVCKNASKTCTCKRRSSGQPDRAEVACDKCGKLWRDEENSGSSICRTCRLVPFENKICKTPVKIDAARVISEHNDSIRCLDCSIVVVPTLAEAIARKLCDGCSLRRDERRSSNEIRYMDTVNAVARGGLTVQRSPNVFSGFATAADDAARTKLEDMRVEHRKEEERSVPVVGSGPPAAPATEHKTPMKNVKLICRGCYGVFDTVSSYKYHCDNCKHRNNEKKPLLSFAKRNTKGGPESTTQTEPANGASFEILEGVQIKYVEMGGGSQSDKAEAGKEPSQIPLVVYESDTSPMKKSDSSRSAKKVKRTHSSPETIMDTIESVIKSICYDTPEPCAESDDKTPTNEVSVTETAVQQQHPSVSEEPSNIAVENLKPEPKDEDGAGQVVDGAQPAKKSSSRSRSSKKRASRRRRPAAKKARKLDHDEAPAAVDKTDVEAEKSVKSEPIEVPGGTDEAKKSSSTSSRPAARSRDTRRSRRRTCTSTAPAGRALRSRTKFYENLSDFKSTETDETTSDPVPESESMDVVDQTPATSPPPDVPLLEDVEKPPAPPKAAPKKRKSESSKSTGKKPRPDTNDLGFAVTKTNKTIPKNAKKASIDPKNVEQLDDHVVESASAPSSSTNQLFVPNEKTIEPRNISTCFEPAAVPVVPVEILIETKRRRSSEISGASSTIYDQESKYTLPLRLPGNEPGSRRDSSVTIASSTGEFQNELGRSFFDDGHGLESGSECTEGSSTKNPTPTYGLDEPNGSGSLSEPGEGQEGTGQSSSSWYTTAWDFFGQKSLGSIIDTMNEILSRPEVSSCSSDSVDLFREQMMMFQHFGGEISAIDKQEEESKPDEETTTFIDLDDISGRVDTKAKSKISSSASCSNPNVFNLDCLICDRTFCNRSGLQSHMINIHGNEGMSKNFKDNKSKQNKANQNGMKTSKHKCSHCQKVLHSKAETLLHMKEHWKTFALSKSSDNGSHLKNSIADKLEELLLDKALMNYLKSPQETQHRNNLPLKILNQISLAKKNQFTNWKSALAQMLEMDTNVPPTTTSATDPPSPVEPPPVAPVEPSSAEKTNSQGTETSNPEEEIDGFPCPMCNKTFEYTRQRNTHLIMVHAPRQSTHKHLLDGKNSSKKGEKTKSTNENCDNKVRKDTAREKIFHSYLLNDSVNTVIKKESLDDLYPPAKPPNRPASSSTSTVDISKPAKKPEKRPVTVKTEALPYPPCSSMDFPTSASTSTSAPLTTTKITPSNPTNSVAAKPSGNDDQQSAKKKKPCRKKMSKKEINLPAAIVKMKAEQALLQLCNSRFNRICTQ